ncbi:MAG TPA: IclR family transcriptional regulator [Pseudonocardiaceae bacterium]|jgi:DNA-binding IclR family transcriptional regulator|nr:IclR family transcriptional regulator [Pseudonocardiaceae bacterium]
MGNNGEGSAALVQSVDRAVAVLELLAARGETGITEIAGELGVHKSTASRLVSVLEGRGLVEQLGQRGKYVIGFGVVRLAGAAIGRLDLATLGLPVCQSLADAIGETINVAVLDGSAAVNITQARGAAAISAQNWIGQRTPLHATSSGKVLLAHVEPARRKEIVNGPLLHYTPNTLTDPAALTEELDEVLATGYAATFEELEIGLNAIAVPIFGAGGKLLAAMSASGPAYRLSRRQTKAIAADLGVGAAELSGQLQLLA